MKLIVTHVNPDMDALSSTWLVRRYLPGYQGEDVEYRFVPAGKTWGGKAPDADPDITHVDTGLGRYDHHQIRAKLSAFEQIYLDLVRRSILEVYDVEPLRRMQQVVTAYDNFQEVYYPDNTADYHEFTLDRALSGLTHVGMKDTDKVAIAHPLFDSVLQCMKNKIKAEKNLSEGIVFETKAFGKSIFMENTNNDSMKHAQKAGYRLVARKDPKAGHIRIVCLPDDSLDLTPVYEQIKRIDSVGTWFLHQSRHMLLNGSIVNPSMVPSPLTSTQVLAILRDL